MLIQPGFFQLLSFLWFQIIFGYMQIFSFINMLGTCSIESPFFSCEIGALEGMDFIQKVSTAQRAHVLRVAGCPPLSSTRTPRPPSLPNSALRPDCTKPYSHWMNEMKACDHLPTHLGRRALHTRRPPPRHVSWLAPSKRYPGKQENVRESPTPK